MEMPQFSVDLLMVQSVIGRVHEKGERHLEGFVHLAGIDLEGDWHGDFGHHRDNAKAGSSRKGVEIAERLDMARIEAGVLTRSSEPVDLADAIAGAVHDLRTRLTANPIHMDVSPDLPFVLVDPQLFQQCLINLIDNAAKYGEPGTPITIAAQREPGLLKLMVMDEGPGLPPGEEDRIFETFARIEGSDRKGGTGLGLAIVRGFCTAMGLSVSAANRTDTHGACFTISFDDAHLTNAEEPA